MAGSAQRDDDEAFERLVVERAAQATGVAYLITTDPTAAREVVGDAWPRIYRAWPRIRPDAHLLARALAPVVARAIRRADKDRGTETGGLDLVDDAVIDRGTVLGGGPDVDVLGEALKDLTPRQRAAVVLRWYVGLDNADLGRSLGRWPPTPGRQADQALRDLMLTSAPDATGSTEAVDQATREAAFGTHLRSELARRAGEIEVDATVTLDRLRPRLSEVTQQSPRGSRRRWTVAAGVAAALVVAGLVANRPGQDDSADDNAGGLTTAADVEPPMAAAGMRLVGFQSVFTSVPGSWKHNQIECGQPVESTVVYPDAASACDPGRTVTTDVPPSSVTFSSPPTNALVVGELREVNVVGDQGVYATVPERRGELLQQIVLIPKADVQMVVRTPDAGVLDDIVDSLQPVPAGYTVVPACARLPLRDAVALLAESGLRVRLFQASNLSERKVAPPVTRQTVKSGMVVPNGTVVGLGFPSMN